MQDIKLELIWLVVKGESENAVNLPSNSFSSGLKILAGGVQLRN